MQSSIGKVPVLRAPRMLALVCVVAEALAAERSASAEEPKIDSVDGSAACTELRANSERAVPAKSAPPVHPANENEILGAPWWPLTREPARSAELIVASVVPHVGAQLRAATPAAVVSWPWSFPFGPVSTCSRVQGTAIVRDFRAHRIVFEPGIVLKERGLAVYMRPAYRFVFHPSDWVVGAGAGLGTTIELAAKNEPSFRPSFSPEVVLQFGHCCDSSYFILTFRYDHYFAGSAVDTVGGSLGYTFF